MVLFDGFFYLSLVKSNTCIAKPSLQYKPCVICEVHRNLEIIKTV